MSALLEVREATAGRYVELVGHRTWVHDDGGDRPPLLLLHGGLGNSDSWTRIREVFGDRFRVVMCDRRGHGRTADTAEEFHHAAMADETVALIEELDLAPVDVVGNSDGAAVLLHLARNRPQLLRAMVLIGVNYHVDALERGAVEVFEAALADDSPAAEFRPTGQRTGRSWLPRAAAWPSRNPPSTWPPRGGCRTASASAAGRAADR